LSQGIIHLSNYPEYISQIRDEIAEKIPAAGTIKLSHIKSITTLNSLFTETTRYYNAFPTRTLEVASDKGFTFESCDVKVPQGWLIAFSRLHGALHTIDSEPEVFVPGRYIDGTENETDALKWTFSVSGLRECPGISIARIQFNIFMVELCLKFKSYTVNKSINEAVWKTGSSTSEKYQLSL